MPTNPHKLELDRRGKLALSESDVQKACISALRLAGWIVRPSPKMGHKAKGSFHVPAGEPDLIAVKYEFIGDGWGTWRVLLIECKAPDGRVSPEQTAWYAAHPFPVYLVRDVDDLRKIPGIEAHDADRR
jgi:hypothetical protein